MQPYYLLYHECTLASGLEWSTKYHTTSAIAVAADAADFAAAETELIHSSVTITRWEYFDATGHKTDDGNLLTGNVGVNGGDMVPIHYAILLRLNVTGGTNRPSTRYIHGWTEAFQTNGTISGAFVAARTTYNIATTAVGGGTAYTDSDGHLVNGHGFRGFSRRKRMRRKPF